MKNAVARNEKLFADPDPVPVPEPVNVPVPLAGWLLNFFGHAHGEGDG